VNSWIPAGFSSPILFYLLFETEFASAVIFVLGILVRVGTLVARTSVHEGFLHRHVDWQTRDYGAHYQGCCSGRPFCSDSAGFRNALVERIVLVY
jgi:hypothetical protein